MTMLLRNLADRALNAGQHVVVRRAICYDLIKQESQLARSLLATCVDASLSGVSPPTTDTRG